MLVHIEVVNMLGHCIAEKWVVWVSETSKYQLLVLHCEKFRWPNVRNLGGPRPPNFRRDHHILTVSFPRALKMSPNIFLINVHPGFVVLDHQAFGISWPVRLTISFRLLSFNNCCNGNISRFHDKTWTMKMNMRSSFTHGWLFAKFPV